METCRNDSANVICGFLTAQEGSLIELPPNIRNSEILSDADKDLLSTVDRMPAVDPAYDDNTLKNIFQYYSLTPEQMDAEVHKHASKLLSEGKVNEAWQVLLTNEIV